MLSRSILRFGTVAAMAGVLALGSGPAAAQTSPITLVVGVAAGGSTDVATRAIASTVEEMGGPRFIIENRPGGGGIPAAVGVKNAAPDGRTLFVASYAPFVVSRAMTEKLPFDPETDFSPITTLFNFPLLLIVPADSKAKSVAELVAISKSNPAGITYGSQGVGTAGHLLGEQFARFTGAKLVHVPYKGAGQAVVDLVAGRIDMMFIGTLPSTPHIKAGKLRPLAVLADQRLSPFPDVPSTEELGLKNLKSDFVWFGVVAPANTPDDAIQNLHGWFTKAVKNKNLIDKLEVQGIILETMTPKAFAGRIKSDYEQFAPIIKEAMGKK